MIATRESNTERATRIFRSMVAGADRAVDGAQKGDELIRRRFDRELERIVREEPPEVSRLVALMVRRHVADEELRLAEHDEGIAAMRSILTLFDEYPGTTTPAEAMDRARADGRAEEMDELQRLTTKLNVPVPPLVEAMAEHPATRGVAVAIEVDGREWVVTVEPHGYAEAEVEGGDDVRLFLWEAEVWPGDERMSSCDGVDAGAPDHFVHPAEAWRDAMLRLMGAPRNVGKG